MRRLFLFFLAISFAVAGCERGFSPLIPGWDLDNQSIASDLVDPGLSWDTEVVFCHVTTEDCVDTKTVNSGSATLWAESDQLTVVNNQNGSEMYVSGHMTYRGNNTFGGRMTYSGDVNDWYMIYPHRDDNKTPRQTHISVAASQVQNGNSNMTHIAGEGFPLVGKELGVPRSEQLSVRMRNVLSRFDFKVTNTTSGPIVVKSVEFTATSPIVGDFVGDITYDNISWTAEQGASKTVLLTVNDGEEMAAGTVEQFYAGVIPFSIPAGSSLKAKVTATDANNNEVVFYHLFDIQSNTNISSGKTYTFNLSFDANHGTDPAPEDPTPVIIDIGGMFHHMNLEMNDFIIPPQSLFDIGYAKSLGFKVIEGNLHACSDGVYVVKHGGANNTLGLGLDFGASGFTMETKFSEVSSTELRTYVTFSPQVEKYRCHIPTLEEFCTECARQGVIPYFRGAEASAILPIVRKYLPDERVICESGEGRGDFRGMMAGYGKLTSPEDILAQARICGAPYFYGLGAMTSLSDSEVTEIINTMHDNGFLIAGSYMSATEYQKYKRLGMDLLGSYTDVDIPSFDIGNTLNVVGCSSSVWELNGANYNSTRGTIELDPNAIIMVNDAALGHNLSKLCLKIVFNGKVDIFLGSPWLTAPKIIDLESDGEQEIVIAHAAQNVETNQILTITAKEATEIIDINLYGSVVVEL